MLRCSLAYWVKGPAGSDIELILTVGEVSDIKVLLSALHNIGVAGAVRFCKRCERDRLSLFKACAALGCPCDPVSP